MERRNRVRVAVLGAVRTLGGGKIQPPAGAAGRRLAGWNGFVVRPDEQSLHGRLFRRHGGGISYAYGGDEEAAVCQRVRPRNRPPRARGTRRRYRANAPSRIDVCALHAVLEGPGATRSSARSRALSANR